MRRVGEVGNARLARDMGYLVGQELRAVGVNYDFAPVLDVDTNPDNPVIGDRAFSRDPKKVAQLALAFAEGLRLADVIPCGKHFPGHGDTNQDSHKTLPRIDRDLDSLRKTELVPFAAAAEAGLASIMTAHVLYPALDAELPATLSPYILQKLLREELGYDGVVVSDDFEMAAIAERFAQGEAARLALAASVDLMLVCHREDRQEAVFEALSKAPRSLLETAYRRIEQLTRQLPPFRPIDVSTVRQHIKRPEHQAWLTSLHTGTIGQDPTEA
jgi:beta-N-acetylhexosaminidase